MVRILLVRHGETEYNRNHILQGRIDVPLNKNGELQAEKLAQRLAEQETVDALYSSDLSRALQTATTIANTIGSQLRVEVDSRLGEFDSGIFAGQPRATLSRKFPKEWNAYQTNDSYVVPQGESYCLFSQRVQLAFQHIVSKHALGSTIIVVAHGGVIDCITAECLIEGENRNQSRCGNASLSEIRFHASHRPFTLVRWNDTSHLAASAEPSLEGGSDDV
jgi:probable phosphoglycerate mutase